MGRPKKNPEADIEQQTVAEYQNMMNEGEKVIPRYQDANWHDFVMSQFAVEELDPKGNPKVDGLRRVAEGLLGEIVESRPVQSSCSDGIAAVNWVLTINWACGNPEIDLNVGLQTRTFGAFADASTQNCNKPYSNFLASMADTRAEAKALRRALRLRCLASEEAELGEINTFEKVSDGNYAGDEKLNSTQLMLIKVISERIGVDPEKLSLKTYNKNIDKLTKTEAANNIVYLNKLQSSIKEKSEGVPDDIKV